jgi:hypothetical protein
LAGNQKEFSKDNTKTTADMAGTHSSIGIEVITQITIINSREEELISLPALLTRINSSSKSHMQILLHKYQIQIL